MGLRLQCVFPTGLEICFRPIAWSPLSAYFMFLRGTSSWKSKSTRKSLAGFGFVDATNLASFRDLVFNVFYVHENF